jgi:hypothetical protein
MLRLLDVRSALASWLCGLVLLASLGMPWLALVHAAEHQRSAAAVPQRVSVAATDHDEHGCVICELLATASAPVDQPGDAPEPLGCVVASPLEAPLARGPPAIVVCFAPLARGPPSVVVTV